MQFTYEGFTHNGTRRCFSFRAVEKEIPDRIFLIAVELPLFAKNRVPVQDGPSFCLQLLTRALSAGSGSLDKLLSYQVVNEDFRPLLVERERRAAAEAVKRRARNNYRKPPLASQLRMEKRPWP